MPAVKYTTLKISDGKVSFRNIYNVIDYKMEVCEL